MLPSITPVGPRCSRKTATVLALIVLAGTAAGCGDVLNPGSESLTTAELLMLPLQPDAPAPEQQSTYVVNSLPLCTRSFTPTASIPATSRSDSRLGAWTG